MDEKSEAFASMNAPSVEVNGVPIVPLVLGSDQSYPAIPEDGSADWANVWSTAQIAMFRTVAMTDGQRWEVIMTQAMVDGSYVITLESDDHQVGNAFQIAREFLDIPIWWTGIPAPSTQPPVDLGDGDGGSSKPPPPPG
jgi:hypothetical protein